jgi:hypothetical protein
MSNALQICNKSFIATMKFIMTIIIEEEWIDYMKESQEIIGVLR